MSLDRIVMYDQIVPRIEFKSRMVMLQNSQRSSTLIGGVTIRRLEVQVGIFQMGKSEDLHLNVHYIEDHTIRKNFQEPEIDRKSEIGNGIANEVPQHQENRTHARCSSFPAPGLCWSSGAQSSFPHKWT